jgi:predicted nucleic acid-binding protein
MGLSIKPSDLVGLDSNVIVYALDDRYPEKQSIARHCLLATLKSRRLILSPQAISETYQVVVRKLAAPSPILAQAYLKTLLDVVTAPINARTIQTAWQIEAITRIQWWDAMMVAHAVDNGCKYLLTEDLQDGFQCGDLMLCNPFRPDRIALIDQL